MTPIIEPAEASDSDSDLEVADGADPALVVLCYAAVYADCKVHASEALVARGEQARVDLRHRRAARASGGKDRQAVHHALERVLKRSGVDPRHTRSFLSRFVGYNRDAADVCLHWSVLSREAPPGVRDWVQAHLSGMMRAKTGRG